MKVIFACVHNAGRSQMAAGLFNLLSDPQKARALSAGTQPALAVHPEVIAVMKEEGLDLTCVEPQLLTAEFIKDADLLITMGCGEACPYVPGLKRADWPIQDPKGQPLERVRDIKEDVRQRVRKLVEEHGVGTLQGTTI